MSLSWFSIMNFKSFWNNKKREIKQQEELAEYRRIEHIDFDKASNTWVDQNRHSYKRIRRKL